MRKACFLIPGDLAAPTGGYAYARRILPLMAGHGVDLRHVALPGGFPHPAKAELAFTRETLESCPADAVLLFDGLALGAMPPQQIAPLGPRIVALVHHPLGLESGLDAARAKALIDNEAAVLALCGRVVATSRLTAETLAADFGVPTGAITVAEPGTDPAPASVGSAPGSPLSLVAVGAVSPRKAYPLLVEALASVDAVQDWHLTIIGAHDRDTAETAKLRETIARHGLESRVTLAGAVDDAALAAHYHGADIFVSASLYEGYGMVLAEAMARGLPMVVSTGGAAAQTAPDDAALKVPPGDAGALSTALLHIISDTDLRRRLAGASTRTGAALPRWNDTARIIANVIRDYSA
ncbi:MAG: glycosyltransferase family 4 protein [Salinarimonas sp.]|nr:glycosyltransferase family 4 protein [Salinarimonas sp.]